MSKIARINIRFVIVLWGGMLCMNTPARPAELQVVPAVQSWTPGEGTFDATAARVVVLPADAQALGSTAEMFRRELATVVGAPGGSTNEFMLTLTGGDAAKP